MVELSKWKKYFVLMIILMGCIFFLPNLIPEKTLEKLPGFFPKSKIVLGLDLQGGSHLLMEVDMDTLMEEKYDLLSVGLKKQLREEKLFYQKIEKKQDGLIIQFRDSDITEKALNFLERKHFDLTWGKKALDEIRIAYQSNVLAQIRKDALERSMEVVRRRVDSTGTLEPILLSEGDRRIVIQLPGVEDPKYIRKLLGKTAKLAFHLVEKVLSGKQARALPAMPGKKVLPSDDEEDVFYFMDSTPLLTGDFLEKAQAMFSGGGDREDLGQSRPVVAIGFNRMGASIFSDITQKYFKQPLAIVLDDRVLSAPNISAHITDGQAVISSEAKDFTIEKAGQLALLMRSGALPAPLSVLEERIVGPSLGQDSIHRGAQSVLFSFGAVSLFVFLFYSFFGFFAIVALFFNLILMLGSLSVLGATLTLPGIAGIAIALGMAVDANILINERIKEELNMGRALGRALSSGYEKAKTAILDSNLTTLIGALILYCFGTGSVRGFAVTLALGVMISMFTATVFSFVLVSKWFSLIKPKKLFI
jgi:preprotein translocase subunit SecD